jgi:hypothetical protein
MQPVAKRVGPAIWCVACHAEDKHKPDRIVQRHHFVLCRKIVLFFLFFLFYFFYFSKNLGFKVLSYDTAQNPQLFRILFMAHQSTHGAAGRGWLELKVHNTPTPLRSAVTHEGFSAGIMIQCPVRLVFRLELAGAGPRYWLGRVAERVGRAAL